MTKESYIGGKKCDKCGMIMVKRSFGGGGWSGTTTKWVCPAGHIEDCDRRGGWQDGKHKDREN